MKQLLIETINFHSNPVILKEEKGRGRNIFVEGILATAEIKNGNGRYYSRELWEREIDSFNQKISQNSTEACGELDHPESQIINLKNTSHVIRKTWWDGDDIMGLIEVFNDPGEFGTQSGRIVGALIKNGLNVGVSSRGMGSLEQKGELMEVQNDFNLICFDFVSNPSNPNSWMKQLSSNLNENKIVSTLNKYNKVNSIITDILCANGTCPVL
jgi:hypothetical protein